jgi:uncharacterized protein YbjT (DUF2867 family)
MKMKTATILGSTGLIGGHLLELLKNDREYDVIRIVVRRPVIFDHPKIKVIVIDFADEAAFRAAISESDVVFCAVGTTNSKVKGDKSAYRRVDFDIPVNAARFCGELGCNRFLLVSSIGADSKSKNFYLRLKGEVEDAIRNTNIQAISIFQPSFLLGDRQENRGGEKVVQVMSASLSFLFPSRYKPIKAQDVARSMVIVSKTDTSGTTIYQYNEMISLLS